MGPGEVNGRDMNTQIKKALKPIETRSRVARYTMGYPIIQSKGGDTINDVINGRTGIAPPF